MKQNVRWLNHLQYSETSAGRITILPADVFIAHVVVGGHPPTARRTFRMSHPTTCTSTLSIQIDKVAQIERFPCTTKNHGSNISSEKYRGMSHDIFSHINDRNRRPQAFQEGGCRERF